MRFSERIGKVDVRRQLQIEDIDERLENKLWNHILGGFILHLNANSNYGIENVRGAFFQFLWTDFFHRKVDEIPKSGGKVLLSDFLKFLKEWYINSMWYEKYDLVEFLAKIKKAEEFNFVNNVNETLKSEMAGYTIINGNVLQITSEEEVASIQEAIHGTETKSPVQQHLVRALELLSNREKPDFRNSIKESISAVEAYSIILTDNPKATLGQALKEIETTHNLHPTLKRVFSTLYGYSSETGGIRHSLLEDDIIVTYEDAKFMLVSCSAFVNYLSAKINNVLK